MTCRQRRHDLDCCRIYQPHDLGQMAYVDLVFEQIRVAGASQPAVCIALLSTLARLHEPARSPEGRDRVRKAAERLRLATAT